MNILRLLSAENGIIAHEARDATEAHQERASIILTPGGRREDWRVALQEGGVSVEDNSLC